MHNSANVLLPKHLASIFIIIVAFILWERTSLTHMRPSESVRGKWAWVKYERVANFNNYACMVVPAVYIRFNKSKSILSEVYVAYNLASLFVSSDVLS